MQYVIYFAVTAPLVLGGLLWVSANTPPQPTLFSGGYNAVADQAQVPPQVAIKAAANKVVVKNPNAIADNNAKSPKTPTDQKG